MILKIKSEINSESLDDASNFFIAIILRIIIIKYFLTKFYNKNNLEKHTRMHVFMQYPRFFYN